MSCMKFFWYKMNIWKYFVWLITFICDRCYGLLGNDFMAHFTYSLNVSIKNVNINIKIFAWFFLIEFHIVIAQFCNTKLTNLYFSIKYSYFFFYTFFIIYPMVHGIRFKFTLHVFLRTLLKQLLLFVCSCSYAY